VQHVHYVGGVSGNLPGLMYPLASDRIWRTVRLRLFARAAAVLGFELLDAVGVSLQLAGDLGLVEFPGRPLSKPWVVLLCVQVDNVSEDRHQRQEKAEDVMSGRVSCGTGTRSNLSKSFQRSLNGTASLCCVDGTYDVHWKLSPRLRGPELPV
jgi:hypothetical protein